MRMYYCVVMCALAAGLLLSTTKAFPSSGEGQPNYETRYAKCWVNFYHVVDEQSFGNDSGRMSGIATINNREYRFSSSWQAEDISKFKGKRPAAWSLAQGLLYCIPKKTVTATRSCSPVQKGSTGALSCDVCIGDTCKRIRAILTFTPLR